MTLLYTDPLFLQHETGRHPERPERLRAVSARLQQAGLLERCTAGTYRPLTEGAVTEVHAPEVVARIKQLKLGGRLDPDLPMLVLSGRGSELDRLRGFDSGADSQTSNQADRGRGSGHRRGLDQRVRRWRARRQRPGCRVMRPLVLVVEDEEAVRAAAGRSRGSKRWRARRGRRRVPRLRGRRRRRRRISRRSEA